VTLDDEVVQRVNDLGPTPWSGQTFRHTSRGREPLSGTGARRFGGRWNPADICATIYLAQPKLTCLDEFARLARANNQAPEDMLRLPRELQTIDVANLPVLDLREEASLEYVGLRMEDILDEDWTACQAVGHAAFFLDYGGIVASSATGSGLVIAAFEARVKPGELTVLSTETLDAASYKHAHPGTCDGPDAAWVTPWISGHLPLHGRARSVPVLADLGRTARDPLAHFPLGSRLF